MWRMMQKSSTMPLRRERRAISGDIESDGDVVHFEHGDVSGIDFAGVLEAADVKGEELRFDDSVIIQASFS